MKSVFISCFILLSFIFLHPSGLIFAQEERNLTENQKEEKKRQLLLREMQRLIETARMAGFSEEEIRNIKLQRNGKVYHVWSFVEEEKQRYSQQQTIPQQPKKYLTVQDITEELIEEESESLSTIRQELFFSGEEEK